MGQCPVHDDDKPSLSTTLRDGKVLVHCFVCGGGDVFVAELSNQGLWPVKPDGQELALASSRVAEVKTVKLVWRPSTPPPPVKITEVGYQVAMIHEYKTVDGHVIGTVTRFEKQAPAHEKPAKTFRPMFCYEEDGKEVWHSRMPPTRPLYGAQTLSRVTPKEIILVEGEKTCDAAQRAFPDHPCVSPMGGVQGLTHSDLQLLRGRKIILWPDHDENWREVAESWISVLKETGVSGLRLVQLDRCPVKLPLKWDLADGINNYQTIVNGLLKSADQIRLIASRLVESIDSKEDLLTHFVAVNSTARNSVVFVFKETNRELSHDAFNQLYLPYTHPIGTTPARYFMAKKETKLGAYCEGYDYVPGAGYVVERKNQVLWNLYRPAQITPIDCDFEDLEPFFQHLDWLFTEEDARLFLCRVASMIQQPEKRPTWVYLIQGPTEGTGKTSLLSLIGKLVGEENYAEVDPNQIYSEFNAHYVGKLMVVFSEFAEQEKLKFVSNVKRLITDQTLSIRRLYHDAVTVTNYMHLFGTTNLEQPIPLNESDRRFHIARVKPIVKETEAYYKRWWSFYKDSLTPGRLLHFFRTFDLTDYSFEPESSSPVLNEAKQIILMNSRSRAEQRIVDLMEQQRDVLRYKFHIDTELAKFFEVNNVNQTWERTKQFLIAHYNAIQLKGFRYYPGKGHKTRKPTLWLILHANPEEGTVIRTKAASNPLFLWDSYQDERGSNSDDVL